MNTTTITIYEKRDRTTPRANDIFSNRFLAGEDPSQSHSPTQGSSETPHLAGQVPFSRRDRIRLPSRMALPRIKRPYPRTPRERPVMRFCRGSQTVTKQLRTPKLSILIACSSAPLRAHLRTLLNREEGLSLCSETDSGTAALDLFFRYRPDVVLADVSLPDRSGFMVIECIKLAAPDCRAILLCHAADPCIDEVGHLVGADHVCHTAGELKPILT